MNMRSVSIILAAVGAAALAGAACSSGGGSGTPTPSMILTFPNRPVVTPQATPTGPVYLDNLFPNGTSTVAMGKCLGFEVVGNTVTFGTGATVSIGGIGNVPTTWVDPSHLQVGAPETGGTCFFTPIFGKVGPADVTVTDGSAINKITGGVTFTRVVYDLGKIGPTTQVWAKDVLAGASAGAGVLETPYDVDVYKATFTTTAHVFPHANFFDLSGVGLVPAVEMWNTNWPNTPMAEGVRAVIFPEDSVEYFVVRDRNGQGGPGATYDLAVIGDQIVDQAPSGFTCANAPTLNPGAYEVDDRPMTNNYDPQGNSACQDSFFNQPLFGPGVDTVWKVNVPAGKEIRVAAYDDQWASNLYILPGDQPCNPQPNNCLSAGGHFGVGNTNAAVWANTGSSDQTVFVMWDG